MQNHHGGLILHEGYVYTGTGHNKGFPLCVKMADGEVAVVDAAGTPICLVHVAGRWAARFSASDDPAVLVLERRVGPGRSDLETLVTALPGERIDAGPYASIAAGDGVSR